MVETFRLHAGVTDTRGHMNWLDDDLKADRGRPPGDVQEVPHRKEYDAYGSRARPRPPARGSRRRRQGRPAPSSPTASTPPRTASAPGCSRGRGTSISPTSPTSGSSATPTATARPTRQTSLQQRLRRPRRLPRPRPARPAVRAGRQALLLVGDRGFNVKTIDGRSRLTSKRGSVLRCEPDGIEPRNLRHGPAQPAGAGLRRARQPVHRRQQLRQRRQGPLGPHRRGRRQRLADRLPVHRVAQQPRDLEHREALASRVGGPGRYLLPPPRQHRRRALGPDV